ncbi:hypothetical protein NLX83_04565 [Allokutzneria sp. A3M-2-11 16]|uniref:hypothetical protein n=1 Tax=Allokutzneria sp. A3M-2-11 16 TaxID=2962043 RepID=UPI0020B714BB|nr:hypothetical protein [Allokutzneria sp. A3M-2-11 16]MCP3798525.1 hypothetical protein [Allokutzneria sp. A3M-2-11 16]
MKNTKNLSLADHPFAGGIGMSAPEGSGMTSRGGAWTITAPVALKPLGTSLPAAALHVAREDQPVDVRQNVRTCSSVPVDRSP